MASRGMSFDRIKEVFDAGKQAEAARKEAVRIAVELSPGAPDSLVFALKDALVPQTAQAMIHVGALASNEPILVNPEADLCIILCGSETSLTRTCARRAFLCAFWRRARWTFQRPAFLRALSLPVLSPQIPTARWPCCLNGW